MIKLIAAATLALGFATSVEAMPRAPLQQPESMVTQIREGCGAGRVRVNGVCVTRRYGYDGYLRSSQLRLWDAPLQVRRIWLRQSPLLRRIRPALSACRESPCVSSVELTADSEAPDGIFDWLDERRR